MLTLQTNGTLAGSGAVDNTGIVAVPPSGVASGPVVVVVNSVQSNANQIFTVTTPTITGVTPPSAPPGGLITINGSNLLEYGVASHIFLNGTELGMSYATYPTSTAIDVQFA